ncbi:MAG TPA: HDOD domain-containing protein [Desulfonatronum sp.]|nr:HDOD domain-containing protein [Desulfonatronum sp.]
MGILALEDIQPGMILASDLRTSQGRLLLPRQAAIEAKHLRMARIWGISEADIEGVIDQPDKNVLDSADPALRDLFQEILAWRFANHDGKVQPMRRLMDLFVHRLNALAAAGMEQDLLRERFIGPFLSISLEQETSAPLSGRVLSCEEMLLREPSLACHPDIFHEIVEASGNPKISAAHLAEIIGKDPSLASRLLRLVNSAFYSFENKVDTLARAAAIVGTVQIANLAVGVSVISHFKGIPSGLVDMRAFWEHSIAVGVISRLLGVHRRIPIRERLFIAGLLHDLGRLVIYKNHLQQARALMTLALSSSEPMHELERASWGFTHAELGSLLLRKWRIPQVIQNSVACHHASFRSEATDEAKLVHLADVIAHALGFGHSGLRRVPPLCLKTWDHIGLPVSVLSTVAAQTDNQLRDLMRVFAVS